MAHYIQFDAGDGTPILVEVDATEMPSGNGIVKAGLGEVLGNTVASAQNTFHSALRVVRRNAEAFIFEMREMELAPDEIEVTFGLKATGELGNFAIGKANGEANYTVRMKWAAKPAAQTDETQ